jgi:hypothetical protein
LAGNPNTAAEMMDSCIGLYQRPSPAREPSNLSPTKPSATYEPHGPPHQSFPEFKPSRRWSARASRPFTNRVSWQ